MYDSGLEDSQLERLNIVRLIINMDQNHEILWAMMATSAVWITLFGGVILCHAVAGTVTSLKENIRDIPHPKHFKLRRRAYDWWNDTHNPEKKWKYQGLHEP